jgi:uncharacterized membrane protein
MNPLIWMHVAAGTAALLAGAAALAARKGGPLHMRAGTTFFAAMLVMAPTGALVAALVPERGTAVIGIITTYLVATSWMTARRRDGRTGAFEIGAFLVAAACAAAMAAFGWMASQSPSGLLDSLPAGAHYPFAVVAALAAGLDLAYIRRGRSSGAQRIRRHLWRMCAALLIAAMSFFLGQQDEFPQAWRGSPMWFAPPVAVFAAMIFWLVRLRFPRAFNRVRSPLSLAAADA